MMGQNHIGDLNVTKMTSAVAPYTNDVDLYPGMVKKWGLSFLINTAKTPEGRSPGSLAWAGLANTYYWIDPVARRHRRDPDAGVAVRATAKCLEAFAGFERGVYAGLDAGRARRRRRASTAHCTSPHASWPGSSRPSTSCVV